MKRPAKPSSVAGSPPAASKSSRIAKAFKNRDGLGVYTANPAAFPASRVIYYNERFVVINDMYPKATVHTLLLPRSAKHALQHPYVALEDPDFLAEVKVEAARLKTLVAKELKRRFGQLSVTEQRREAALANPVEGAEIPPGRDWEADVKVGIHACPSMNHLHVHVLSRDMHSPTVKHRKHYNSFNTPFLVDIADFPLVDDDLRLDPASQDYLRTSLRCWRCGKEFGKKFKELKEHLEEEFEAWVRE